MISLKKLQVACDNNTIVNEDDVLEVLNAKIETKLSKIKLLLNQYAV